MQLYKKDLVHHVFLCCTRSCHRVKQKYSLRGKVSHRHSHNIPIKPYTSPLSFQLQLFIGRGHFSTNFLPIILHENPSIFPEIHFLFLSRFHLIFSRHQRDFMRTGETLCSFFCVPISYSQHSNWEQENDREKQEDYRVSKEIIGIGQGYDRKLMWG